MVDGILETVQLTTPGHLKFLTEGGPIRYPKGLQLLPNAQGHLFISPGMDDHKVIEFLIRCF